MNDALLVFLATAGLISIILVVVIWQLAVTWRAKAALVREGEYRQLAERAVASNEETQTPSSTASRPNSPRLARS